MAVLYLPAQVCFCGLNSPYADTWLTGMITSQHFYLAREDIKSDVDSDMVFV